VRTSAARTARQSRAFQLAARGGYATNGLLHVLMGLLAIGVVTGVGLNGEDADTSGALTAIARTPGGEILLWVLVAGLAALGLWYAIEAAFGHVPNKRAGRAIATGAQAIVYFALAGSALTVALGGRADSSEDARTASSVVLSAPGGVVLLTLAGAVVLAIGVYFIVKGVRRKFRDDVRLPDGRAGTAVLVLGTVGYVAKGIALVALGVLIIVAAITTDPSQVTGLDGALRGIADLPLGAILLVIVGAGLIAYGVYCGARARWARL
jgi:hypothetical protein